MIERAPVSRSDASALPLDDPEAGVLWQRACRNRGEGARARIILVAGVDEAGRGPLAGPVAVAAVILDPAHPITGLDDSKNRKSVV